MSKEAIPSDLVVEDDGKFSILLGLFENYNQKIVDFCDQVGRTFEFSAELQQQSAQMATNDQYKNEQSSKHYAITIEYGSLQHTLRVISSNLADVLTQQIHMETDKHVLVHHKDVLSNVHQQLELKRSRLTDLIELMKDASEGGLIPTKLAHTLPTMSIPVEGEMREVCCSDFYTYQQRLYGKITRICNSTSDKRVIGTGSALIETLGVLETIVSLQHGKSHCQQLPKFEEGVIVDGDNMDVKMDFDQFTAPKQQTEEQVLALDQLVNQIVVIDSIEIEAPAIPAKMPAIPRGPSYKEKERDQVEVQGLMENNAQELLEHSKVLHTRLSYLEDCLDVFGVFLTPREGRAVLQDLNSRVLPELSFRIDSVVGMLSKLNSSLHSAIHGITLKRTQTAELYLEAVKVRQRMRELNSAYRDLSTTLDLASKRNAYLTVFLSSQIAILEQGKYLSAQKLHAVVGAAKAVLEHYKIEYTPGAGTGLIVGNTVNNGQSTLESSETAVLSKVGFSSVDNSVQEAAAVVLRMCLLWQQLQKKEEEEKFVMGVLMGSAMPLYPPHLGSFMQKEQVISRLETVRDQLNADTNDTKEKQQHHHTSHHTSHHAPHLTQHHTSHHTSSLEPLAQRHEKLAQILGEDKTSGKNSLTHRQPQTLPLIVATHAMFILSADALARSCTNIRSQMQSVFPEPTQPTQHTVVVASAIQGDDVCKTLFVPSPLCAVPQGVAPAFHQLNYNAMMDHASAYAVKVQINCRPQPPPSYVAPADMTSTNSCSATHLVTISPLYLTVISPSAPCTACNDLMSRYSQLSKTHHPFSLLYCNHRQSVVPAGPQILVDTGMITGVEFYPHTSMPVQRDVSPLFVTVHVKQDSDGNYSVVSQSTDSLNCKPASQLVNQPLFQPPVNSYESAQLVIHLLPSATNRFYSSTYIEAWLAEFDRLVASHKDETAEFIHDIDDFISGVFPFPGSDDLDEQLISLVKPLVTPNSPQIDKNHLKIVFTGKSTDLQAMYQDICLSLRARRQLIDPFVFPQNQLVVPGITHDMANIARAIKDHPNNVVSALGKAGCTVGAQLPPYIDVVRVIRYMRLQNEQVQLQRDLHTHETTISQRGVDRLVNKMRPKIHNIQPASVSHPAASPPDSQLMSNVLNQWKFTRRHSHGPRPLKVDWRKSPTMEEMLTPSLERGSSMSVGDVSSFFIQAAMKEWFNTYSSNGVSGISTTAGVDDKKEQSSRAIAASNNSTSSSSASEIPTSSSNLPTVKGTSNILPTIELAKLFSHSTRRAQRQVWVRKFSSVEEGSSFTKLSQALVTKCSSSIQSSVVLVKDETGRVFGGYNSKQWRQGVDLGTGESFVFSIEHGESVVYTWKTTNNHFVQMRSTGIGWGGGGDVALWIDQELHGHSGCSETYGNEVLSANPNFKVHVIEVWSQQSF